MQAELAQLTLYLLFGVIWFSLLTGLAAFLSILRQLRLTRQEQAQVSAIMPTQKRATASHRALRVTSDRISMHIQPDEMPVAEQKVG